MELSGSEDHHEPKYDPEDTLQTGLPDEEEEESNIVAEEPEPLDVFPVEPFSSDRIVFFETRYWLKPTSFLLVAYKEFREPDGRPKALLPPLKMKKLKKVLNRTKVNPHTLVEAEVSKFKMTNGILRLEKSTEGKHHEYDGFLFGYSNGLYFKLPSIVGYSQTQIPLSESQKTTKSTYLEEHKFPLSQKTLLGVQTMKKKYYFFSTIDISIWDPSQPKELKYLKRKFRAEFFTNPQIYARNSFGRDVHKVDGRLLFITKNLRLCLVDWPRLSPEPLETEIRFSEVDNGQDVVAFRPARNQQSVFAVVENTQPAFSYHVVRFSLGNENAVKSKYSESSLLWLCQLQPEPDGKRPNLGKVLQEFKLDCIPSTQVVRGISLTPDSIIISSTQNVRVRKPTTKNYFNTFSYSGTPQHSLEWEVPNQEDMLAIMVNPVLDMKLVCVSRHLTLTLAWACVFSLIVLFVDRDGSLQILDTVQTKNPQIRSVVTERGFGGFSILSLDKKYISVLRYSVRI